MVRRPQILAEDGFSLVEMLVALMIISLASVMIVMTLPKSTDDPFETTIASAEDAIGRLESDAVALGRPVGFIVSEAQLEPVVWQGGEWVPARLQVVKAPRGVHFATDGRQTNAKQWPQVRVDPVGVFTPNHVVVKAGGRLHSIAIEAGGIVTGAPS